MSEHGHGEFRSSHERTERAAENVYLRLVARYAMAASLPLMGFILTMAFKAQESAIRQEEKITALSDRMDRQIVSVTTIINSRLDAQGRRIDDMGNELNRLRDYTYRVYPGARSSPSEIK